MISSELWLLPGGAQLSSVSESLGAFLFFLNHENIRQTLGCPTYSSGRPLDSLCHLTGFLQLLRHFQLHCFWVLYRNKKILYHYFENEKALIKLFIILPVWSCQHSVGKNHYKVSSYLILTDQWLALQTSHCA